MARRHFPKLKNIFHFISLCLTIFRHSCLRYLNFPWNTEHTQKVADFKTVLNWSTFINTCLDKKNPKPLTEMHTELRERERVETFKPTQRGADFVTAFPQTLQSTAVVKVRRKIHRPPQTRGSSAISLAPLAPVSVISEVNSWQHEGSRYVAHKNRCERATGLCQDLTVSLSHWFTQAVLWKLSDPRAG